MNKKILLFITILFFTSFCIYSQQLSKIAVVDLQKIIKSYGKDSSSLAEVKKIQDDMDKELSIIQEEIDRLNTKLSEAEIQEDQFLIDGIKNQIEKKIKYKQQYFIEMSAKLKSKDKIVKENSKIYNQIYKAIQYVAESGGYSIVFKSSSADILWYHIEVDITSDVITRLKETGF